MERQEAIRLIEELVMASSNVTKQVNNGGRGLTKTAVNREAKAVREIFKALTGSNPSSVEIEEITG